MLVCKLIQTNAIMVCKTKRKIYKLCDVSSVYEIVSVLELYVYVFL